MACVTLPEPPDLAALFAGILPITLVPPASPTLDLSVDLCCRIDFKLPLPPIPISATLALPGAGVAALQALNAALEAVDTVIESIPKSCPLD